MDPLMLIVIAIAVVLVLGAILVLGWLFFRRQRTERLRQRFGPEYDYTLSKLGDQRKAELELADREKQVKSLDVRSLTREESDRFANAWQAVQRRFVDEPVEAIVDADLLVAEVMEARGYPVADFEQRVAYFSASYPQAAGNYRAAYVVAQKAKHKEATTEDLRQAMIYYRDLFKDLLETNGIKGKETKKQETSR